jgi:DNA segregation ATPase FtsK/SpoIIIE, S-DNA-T family
MAESTPVALSADEPSPKDGELGPILPPWTRDRAEFTGKISDLGKRTAHAALWHLWHAPANVLRVLWFAARGLWRVVVIIWGWVFDAEHKSLRRDAIANKSHDDHFKHAKLLQERVNQRLKVLAVLIVLALIVVFILWFLSPRWQIVPGWTLTPKWLFTLLATAGVGALGYVGRPRDGKPLIIPATASTGDTPLTNSLVLEALCSLGIQKMTRPDQIELLYPVKPARAGYHIDLILPRGVTAISVMEKRRELSSALQRGIGTVWPSVGERHEGHLVLFVSHQDMSKAQQKPWPLLKQGSVNVFRPAPMFTDQRGEWVDLRLATTCGIIGAVPRMGKTFFQRELGLVCALDVRVEEYIFELKGTGDLSCLKLVAHYYSDSDEEEDIAEHLTVMRRLRDERRRRARVIRSLPNEQCPNSEVTDELASRRELRLHPILIEVDECQVWFMHPVKAVREEFASLADDLVRKGPAVGIMAYFSTQELGKDSIPSTVSRNASVRLCFKVNDSTANNKVLGNGAYANGYQATMFDFYKDKGIAYLKAEGPPQIVRTVFAMDKVEADKVALRARAARKQADRLTGYAAGEELEVEEQEVLLVDEIRSLFGTASTMHLGDIATGLAGRRPGTWGSLDAKGLGALLRGLTPPIEPTTVYVADKPAAERSGKGLKREQLEMATTSEIRVDSPNGSVR